MGDMVSIFINLRNTFTVIFVSRHRSMIANNTIPNDSKQSIKFFQNGLSLHFIKTVINFTRKDFITRNFLKIS